MTSGTKPHEYMARNLLRFQSSTSVACTLSPDAPPASSSTRDTMSSSGGTIPVAFASSTSDALTRATSSALCRAGDDARATGRRGALSVLVFVGGVCFDFGGFVVGGFSSSRAPEVITLDDDPFPIPHSPFPTRLVLSKAVSEHCLGCARSEVSGPPPLIGSGGIILADSRA